MKNINPYIEDDFKKTFVETELYSQLEKDFDYLFWDKFANPVPRLMLSDSVVSLPVFHYLNFLIEKNPETIYDIGCGTNCFKPYYPNIIGVDPNTNFGTRPDIVRAFDDSFIQEYENTMDAAFALNGVHFVPFMDYNSLINKFLRLIKPGGRALITFNSLVGMLMAHNIHKAKVYDYFPDGGSVEEKNKMFFETLDVGDNKIICLDVDSQPAGCPLLGDIKIVVEKA